MLPQTYLPLTTSSLPHIVSSSSTQRPSLHPSQTLPPPPPPPPLPKSPSLHLLLHPSPHPLRFPPSRPLRLPLHLPPSPFLPHPPHRSKGDRCRASTVPCRERIHNRPEPDNRRRDRPYKQALAPSPLLSPISPRRHVHNPPLTSPIPNPPPIPDLPPHPNITVPPTDPNIPLNNGHTILPPTVPFKAFPPTRNDTYIPNPRPLYNRGLPPPLPGRCFKGVYTTFTLPIPPPCTYPSTTTSNVRFDNGLFNRFPKRRPGRTGG